MAANWVINRFAGRAETRAGRDIEDSPLSPDQLGGIIELIKDGVISGKIAQGSV